MEKFLTIARYLIEKLSSKPFTGGLELSESSLRFVGLNQKKPETFSLRLPPGIIREGKLENPVQFSEILREFHEMIIPGKDNKIIQTVISLPRANIYTQIFNIPNVGEKNLNETANLNLEAISPIGVSQAYLSWQLAKDNGDHYELLGAVMEKNAINQFKNVFEGAKFQPLAFEFPALSLSRLLDKVAGIQKDQSLLLFWISSEGLSLFVFRGGSVYFDYFKSWRSIQSEGREIPKSVFESVIVDETQKVMNFTSTRFKENIKDVFIIAPGFEEQTKEIFKKNFNLNTIPFLLNSYDLSPSWYVSFGAAIRSVWDRRYDNFINLGLESPAKHFYEEQILNFVRLWRNIFSGALFLFLLLFGFSAVYLARENETLVQKLKEIRNPSESPETLALMAKAKEFNNLVEGIKKTKEKDVIDYRVLATLQDLARKNQVTLDGIELASLGAPVNLTAHAPDSDAVVKFKNVLSAQKNFLNIDLPLSRISVLPDNSVSFNLSFQINPVRSSP